MKNLFRIVPVLEFSLDELRERVGYDNEEIPFEYKIGAFYEMDAYMIGEIANIKRLINNNYLPKKEGNAISKTLKDYKLSVTERKAKERGIKRMRTLLHIDEI